MNRIATIIPAAIGAGLMLITACTQMLPAAGSIAASHPEELAQERPLCSECHKGELKGLRKPYAAFDHDPVFVKEHRLIARTDSQACALCHKQSFCTDCHANHIEIKPSKKLGDRLDRELIHRGDYLTRHKIEGKVDPVSCYSCHGRTNNEKCAACHR